MYDRTYWLDHVVDQNGNVIQQGTLQDQAHFNKMEQGICDTQLAGKIREFCEEQESYTDTEETIDVRVCNNAIIACAWIESGKTMSGTKGSAPAKWPFGNSPVTVALAHNRNTDNYTVDVYVTGHSGGYMGSIAVQDKALNGFKLLHDGSATEYSVRLKVRGGMTV